MHKKMGNKCLKISEFSKMAQQYLIICLNTGLGYRLITCERQILTFISHISSLS